MTLSVTRRLPDDRARGREEIARIIDPQFRDPLALSLNESRTDQALTKADAVLAFTSTTTLPPLVDRAELIALLEDLASVNLSPEACARQARRMADDLIARGAFTRPESETL